MRLIDCKGALSEKKFPDSEATRRNKSFWDEAQYVDDDEVIMQFGSPFRVDAYQKILASKAFRRLASKTQVITGKTNKHIRTRLTHTFEVMNVASAIARVLGLNEDLCLAIAAGHDIGHTPLGHAGEAFISKVTGKSFRHEKFAIILAQMIERKCKGMNLTKQTLQGILSHSRGSGNCYLAQNIFEEANVVMYSDKIAYIFADINDVFVRSKIMNIEDFPELSRLLDFFGDNQRERVANCIEALCLETVQKNKVSFSDSEIAISFNRMKSLMYPIYDLTHANDEKGVLEKSYEFLSGLEICQEVSPALILALMTDADVFKIFRSDIKDLSIFDQTSVAELIPCLKNKDIPLNNLNLSW